MTSSIGDGPLPVQHIAEVREGAVPALIKKHRVSADERPEPWPSPRAVEDSAIVRRAKTPMGEEVADVSE